MAKYILTQTLTTIIDEIKMIEIALSCNDQKMRNEYMNAGRLERLKINLQQLEVSLNAREDRSDAVDDTTTGLQQQIAALDALIRERKMPVPLPDVIIPAPDLITLLAGEKSYTRPCAGAKTTDTLLLTIKQMGVSYGLRGWSIPTNDNVNVRIQCPILSIGGSPIIFAATAFR